MDETRADRALLLWPFAATVVLTFVLALVPGSTPGRGIWLLAAAGCFLAVGLCYVLLPWDRILWVWSLPIVAVFSLGVAFLRHSGGGSNAGYGPLLLIPVIWLALHGRPAEVWFAVGCVGATVGLPVLLLGAPDYPVSQWRLAVLLTLMATTVGAVVQRLTADQQRLLGRLDSLASHDELTGLWNRRRWNEALHSELQVDRRGVCRTHVALIDLDDFKRFNDTHGHLAGDEMLSAASAAWSSALRQEDVLARWGGEEFVVLLAGTTMAQAERIVARMAELTPAGLTFSGGLVDATGMTLAEVMVTADGLLYAAKSSGRNLVLTNACPPAVGPAARPSIH